MFEVARFGGWTLDTGQLEVWLYARIFEPLVHPHSLARRTVARHRTLFSDASTSNPHLAVHIRHAVQPIARTVPCYMLLPLHLARALCPRAVSLLSSIRMVRRLGIQDIRRESSPAPSYPYSPVSYGNPSLGSGTTIDLGLE